MHLDLDGVESFVVLVEEGHYGHAAARLHVTSPTLTKRVQRLERHLRVRLFHRDQNGMLGLTEAGVRLAAAAGPLLEHELATRRAVRGCAATVTLGVPHDGDTASVTAQELREVRRLLYLEHPDVALVCRRTPLPDVTTWLLEGEVDVQLTAGVVQHRRVHSTAVAAVPRMAAVPARSDLGDAVQVQVEDLLELPMLYDPCLPPEFMSPFWLGDMRPARQARLVSIAARDSGAVLEQVARSAGVTILLASQAGAAPPRVRLLPIVGASPLVLHAARRAVDQSPVVESLVDALRTSPLARG